MTTCFLYRQQCAFISAFLFKLTDCRKMCTVACSIQYITCFTTHKLMKKEVICVYCCCLPALWPERTAPGLQLVFFQRLFSRVHKSVGASAGGLLGHAKAAPPDLILHVSSVLSSSHSSHVLPINKFKTINYQDLIARFCKTRLRFKFI